jgi:hypothetical protein
MSDLSPRQLREFVRVAIEIDERARALQESVAGFHNLAEASDSPYLQQLATNLTGAAYPDVVECSFNPNSGRRTVKKFVTGDGMLYSDLISRVIQIRKKP